MKDLHTQVDKLVRQRLNDAPAPLPDNGWDALERSLDEAADAPLREALTELPVTPVPAWAALADKLDTRSPEDRDLADRLEALEPAVATASWLALEERLDEQVASEVDQLVATNLEVATPTHVTGWAALAARLELIGWRRETVAAWKVIEVALLASMFLLFLRFGPPAEPAPVLADAGFPVAETDLTLKENLVNVANAVQSASGDISPLPRRGAGGEGPAGNVSIADKATNLKQLSGAAIKNVQASKNAGIAVKTPEAPATKANAATYVSATVATLELKPLHHTTNLPSPGLWVVKTDKAEPTNYYLNSFVSPLEFNEVVTPGSQLNELEVKAGRRLTYGISAGALIDVSKGLNVFQFGVILSQRSYTPTLIAWRANDPELKGYQRFEYTSFQLPLNYKRVFKESNNWRVSGRVGMSLNVIAASRFLGEDDIAKSFDRYYDLDRPRMRPSRSVTNAFQNKQQLENPDPGFLEGGSLMKNANFYFGAGVVVERLLGPRWSIYVSPSFSRVIYFDESHGIGPTKDRLHSGSLRMGSRYLFGNLRK